MDKKFISSSEAIKGCSDSVIAKSERNDCVVRAIASAYDMHYDAAHQLVKEKFHRQNGKGTRYFVRVMNLMSQADVKINNKGIKTITEEHNTMMYYVKVNGVKRLRKTTTGHFMKKYSTGSYIVTVRGHAFTIKDGVIIGNFEDGKKLKKHIEAAWKIG